MNLEAGIITLVSFNILPRDLFIGIPLSDRYTFAAAYTYRAKVDILAIFETLRCSLQQRPQCELRDFFGYFIRAANAFAQ